MRIRCAVVLAAGGIMTAACDRLGGGDGGPTAPSGPSPGATISYTAVGASDVYGFGSSGLCLGVDAPSCMGYAPVAARRLRAQGFVVDLTILGIPTATISGRFEQLGEQYGGLIFGNFIDNLAPLVPRSTALVSVFAGGNDVNAIRAAVDGGAGGSSPDAYIDQQIANFRADYATLLDTIRSRAGDARVIVLNLPNFGALPYLSGASLVGRQRAQRISVGMTTSVINALGNARTTVVDLMCDPALYQAAHLSSDGFHPNDAGYAVIGEKVAAAIASSSYPAPATSCGQMTLVPR